MLQRQLIRARRVTPAGGGTVCREGREAALSGVLFRSWKTACLGLLTPCRDAGGTSALFMHFLVVPLLFQSVCDSGAFCGVAKGHAPDLKQSLQNKDYHMQTELTALAVNSQLGGHVGGRGRLCTQTGSGTVQTRVNYTVCPESPRPPRSMPLV